MHGQRLPPVRLDVARPYLHAGPAFRQALCSTTAWAHMAIAADLGCTDGRILTSELLTVESSCEQSRKRTGAGRLMQNLDAQVLGAR